MPNKIKLQDIIKQLPPFVKIIPETYKGKRYSADFIDTEYNEKFTANVTSVISLQHGCRSRSNKKRSVTTKGRYLVGQKLPIQTVKERLPSYLEIDESTYIGIRNKARFYDKDYKIWFEMYVCNILRDERGFCKERQLDVFKKQITLTPEQIQVRLNELYNGEIILVKENYVNTTNVCSILRKGKRVTVNVAQLLQGKAFLRKDVEKWIAYVNVRDKFTCQKCGDKENRLSAHHVLGWTKFPAHRFNINNGLCLCANCHNHYHSLYKNEETIDNLCLFLNNPTLEQEIRNRLSQPILSSLS